MLPLEIKFLSDTKDLIAIRTFLLKQAQYYPNYTCWVDEKCIPRIRDGWYKALAAYNGNTIIGIAIYIVDDNNTVEIKNFRIDPHYRRRHLGDFLMTQVAFLSQADAIVLDVTVDNFPGVQFFIRFGFEITGKEFLYSPQQAEYIMVKHLRGHHRLPYSNGQKILS